MPKKDIYFAGVGDVHGYMDHFVLMLKQWEKRNKKSLNFVLQVGDFEPHRNKEDLKTMAAPSKYRSIEDFPFYHTGKRVFPWPVFFIGGNHEPYGVLEKNPKGFTFVNNCTYLGRAGNFKFCNLSIAYLSGIYSESHLHKERPSVSLIDRVSNKEYIYFTEQEVTKLTELAQVDILLLHEWPLGVIDPADEL